MEDVKDYLTVQEIAEFAERLKAAGDYTSQVGGLLDIVRKEIRGAFLDVAGPGVGYLDHFVISSAADKKILVIEFAASKLGMEHAVLCYLTEPLAAAAECGRGARVWVETQTERVARRAA